MELGSRVKWLAGNPEGWAGPGIGRIISYDPNRVWFEGNKVPPGSPSRGPAVEIELEHNHLRQWVSPIELEEIPEKEEHEA